MSLRTLAAIVAALLALLVLLWTCAPEKLSSLDPRDAAGHATPVGSMAGPTASGRANPGANAEGFRASAQVQAASCRRVAIALRCHEHLRKVRLSRGARQLSQPPEDGACTAWVSNPVPWRPLFEAARQGHVPSMVRFADGSLFRHDVEWDLEAMALYRTHGYEFLRRAAEAGDGGAIAKLAREMVATAAGEGAIPFDRVRGLAYARLLLRHADADWQDKLTSQTIGSAFRYTAQEWAEAEGLSHRLVSPEAEARLDGWNPNRDGPDNDYGCTG